MSLADQMMAAQTAAAEMAPPPAPPAPQAPQEAVSAETPPAPEATPEPTPTPSPQEELLALQRQIEEARAKLAAAQQPVEQADPIEELGADLAKLDEIRVAIQRGDANVEALVAKTLNVPENADPVMRAMFIRLGLADIITEKRAAYQQLVFDRQLAQIQQAAVVAPAQQRQEQDILGLLQQEGLASEAGLMATVPHYQMARANGGTHEQGLQAMRAMARMLKPAFAPPAPPAAPQAPAPQNPVRVSTFAQIQAARGGAAPPNTSTPAAQRLHQFFKTGRPA